MGNSSSSDTPSNSSSPLSSSSSPAYLSSSPSLLTVQTNLNSPQNISIDSDPAANSAVSELELLNKRLKTVYFSSELFLTAPPIDFPFDFIDYSERARYLLQFNSELSLWRYKLVPQKISEFNFWRNFFYQLQNNPAGANTGETLTKPPPYEQKSGPYQRNDQYSNSPALREESMETLALLNKRLQHELAKSQAEIAELKKQIHANSSNSNNIGSFNSNNTDNSNNSNNNHLSGAICSRCKHNPSASPSCHYHCGSWELDPQSKDFFAFDATLRENLRREKQKKLNEVRSQLKWIIDDDNPENAPGEWSCCKNEENRSTGCTSAEQHTV
jgi:hypothetical protein